MKVFPVPEAFMNVVQTKKDTAMNEFPDQHLQNFIYICWPILQNFLLFWNVCLNLRSHFHLHISVNKFRKPKSPH
jgi:hypothetical protein